jgi:hypothetical protein
MDAVTTDLHYLELTELAACIKAREVSPVTVTHSQLNRIAAVDRALGSYALVMAEGAIEQAEAAQAEIAAGRYRGPLHGVPIAVKDLCWTEGVPTAGGMAIYKDYRPDEDATVVRRLKQAGAVLLGKLQLTEGVFRSPSIRDPAQESVECRILARNIVQRSGGGDGGGSLLWLYRLRYRRVDPLAICRQRPDRAEAELGARQPLRRIRAGAHA